MLDTQTGGATAQQPSTTKIANASGGVGDGTPPSGMLRRCFEFAANNYNNLFTKIPWALAIIVIVAILIQGLFEHVTVIQSISVPQALAERGYTPEVAGNRLRDAVADFVKSANSHMKSPDIALQGDIPDIVVPTVGISLDAVVSELRTLFRSTRSKTITGEFVVVGNKLWLHLRLDGQQLYSSAAGGDPDNPDALLPDAARAILQNIQPYFVPASLSSKDPAQALLLINSIISRYKDSDSRNQNVVWAYNLKGSILTNHKELTEHNDYSAAKEALTTALQMDSRLAAAHVNMGNIFKNENNKDDAIAEYNKAIKLEPTYALAHYVLASYYDQLDEIDDAIFEARLAVKYDLDGAENHFVLAHSLAKKPDDEPSTYEAINEYRQAIRLQPQYPVAHNNLGNQLLKLNKEGEAIAEYQQAIAQDDRYALPLYNWGRALHSKGNDREAVTKLNEAIKLNPNSAVAHRLLAKVLGDLNLPKQAADEMATAQQIEDIGPGTVLPPMPPHGAAKM